MRNTQRRGAFVDFHRVEHCQAAFDALLAAKAQDHRGRPIKMHYVRQRNPQNNNRDSQRGRVDGYGENGRVFRAGAGIGANGEPFIAGRR